MRHRIELTLWNTTLCTFHMVLQAEFWKFENLIWNFESIVRIMLLQTTDEEVMRRLASLISRLNSDKSNGNVISSVFTLYCCPSGPKFLPLFPWSSKAMCCNFIMYILSLVHQRGERARKSDDSPIQVTITQTVPGNCSWVEENDCWHPQKAPSEWR